MKTLGHDLLEGVVSYDLHSVLKMVVQKRKWISLERLNYEIKSFKFNARDRPNPIVLRNKDKLSGGAAQIWTLIRYLPLLLHSFVEDLEDCLWQLLLRLHEVVNMATAPRLSDSDIERLDYLLQEYLNLRFDLTSEEDFPKCRPKHHYISHYADMYSKFGPLTQTWAIR